MASKTVTSKDLFEVIFQGFSSFCKEISTLNPSATKQQESRCRDELERLFLWADGVSIQNGNLDKALSRSSALRSSVISILFELGNAVCNDLCKPIHTSGDFTVQFDEQQRKATDLLQRTAGASLQEYSQAPHLVGEATYGSESFQPDLDDVLDNIATFNGCLMDLSLALERPAFDITRTHLKTSDSAEPFNAPHAALPYCRKIRERFPKLPLYLVGRLGIANLHRANILREIKNLVQSGGHETSAEESFAMFSASTSTVNQGRPRVPPLPEKAGNGNPFICEYCAKTVSGVSTRRQWK